MNIFKKSLYVFLIVVLSFAIILASFIMFSFKIRYSNLVIEQGEKHNIDTSLIFAIIKAESKFDVNAKSSAGAIGLMQIKLDSANYVLSLSSENQITEEDLYLPKNNIKTGVMYLSYLLKKFQNIDTAVCAYNAGETTVREWLSDSRYSLDGVSLIKIPYLETEQYLNKVKLNKMIYDVIL